MFNFWIETKSELSRIFELVKISVFTLPKILDLILDDPFLLVSNYWKPRTSSEHGGNTVEYYRAPW